MRAGRFSLCLLGAAALAGLAGCASPAPAQDQNPLTPVPAQPEDAPSSSTPGFGRQHNGLAPTGAPSTPDMPTPGMTAPAGGSMSFGAGG